MELLVKPSSISFKTGQSSKLLQPQGTHWPNDWLFYYAWSNWASENKPHLIMLTC